MAPLVGLVITDAALDNLAAFPYKIRAQLIKKAKALMLNPHPPGSKKMKGIATDDGEPVYRQRSGKYRILYTVQENPSKVIVFDIGDRKEVYR